MSDEVDFVHTDNHKSLLQIDTMVLMGMVRHYQSFQNIKFALPLRCLKKKRLEVKLIFCMQINIKVFTDWHYRFLWKWSEMSKVPEIRNW